MKIWTRFPNLWLPLVYCYSHSPTVWCYGVCLVVASRKGYSSFFMAGKIGVKPRHLQKLYHIKILTLDRLIKTVLHKCKEHFRMAPLDWQPPHPTLGLAQAHCFELFTFVYRPAIKKVFWTLQRFSFVPGKLLLPLVTWERRWIFAGWLLNWFLGIVFHRNPKKSFLLCRQLIHNYVAFDIARERAVRVLFGPRQDDDTLYATLLTRACFPYDERLATRATFVAYTNLVFRTEKNVSENLRKHFLCQRGAQQSVLLCCCHERAAS